MSTIRRTPGTSLAEESSRSAALPERRASPFQICTTHVSSVQRRTIQHTREPSLGFKHGPVAECRGARHPRGCLDSRRPDSGFRTNLDAAATIDCGVHVDVLRAGDVAGNSRGNATPACSAGANTAAITRRRRGRAEAGCSRAPCRQTRRARPGGASACSSSRDRTAS